MAIRWDAGAEGVVSFCLDVNIALGKVRTTGPGYYEAVRRKGGRKKVEVEEDSDDEDGLKFRRRKTKK